MINGGIKIMNIIEYQYKAQRTINHKLNRKEQLSNLVFGINGEIGEVTDLLKKHLFHGHDLGIQELTEELGDIMWYLTNIATFFNILMTYILQENIKKLEERYPEGFSKEKSINRKEYK